MEALINILERYSDYFELKVRYDNDCPREWYVYIVRSIDGHVIVSAHNPTFRNAMSLASVALEEISYKRLGGCDGEEEKSRL